MSRACASREPDRRHLQELLARLEATLAELEGTEDPEVAVERLAEWLSWRNRSSPRSTGRSGKARMLSPEELRGRVERFLGELPFTAELGELEEALRYSLLGGGKRIRPVLCLATGEALGRDPEEVLPAACSLELVHTFSLVHDDLPALDDDDLRRGQPSSHVRFGEDVAILAGDALLAEALRLALRYPEPDVARELTNATLGMIGGQYLDVTTNGSVDEQGLRELHELKTGRLLEASS